jgi:phosphatidylethanolamine/phosphatidyl-N-methylethanolamine N-methyltransferase
VRPTSPFRLEPGSGKIRIPIEERLADEARFIKSWFGNPLLAGAVSPSGRFLARTMARYVDPRGTAPIIELGPGTGPITEAMLQRGVAPGRLVLVEYDIGFCRLLRKRFPACRVVRADAYRLAESLRGLIDQPAAAVVSSLPLLTKPESQRLDLLDDAFALMAPDGRFIQFTYGVASPIPCGKAGMAVDIEASPPVWLNLPPARVWLYRRAGAGALQLPERGGDFLGRLRLGTEKMQNDLKKEIAAAKARLRPSKARRARASGAGRPASDREPAPRV